LLLIGYSSQMKPKFKQKLEHRYVALAKYCELPQIRWLPTEENLRWLIRYAEKHKNGKYHEIEKMAKQLCPYRPKEFGDDWEDMQEVLKGKN